MPRGFWTRSSQRAQDAVAKATGERNEGEKADPKAKPSRGVEIAWLRSGNGSEAKGKRRDWRVFFLKGH